MTKWLFALALACSGGLGHGASTDRASISGQILDSHGNAALAQVRVYSMVITEGYLTAVVRCDTMTASDGEYQCSSLEAGRYLVQATLLSSATPPIGGTNHCAPFAHFAFYPGVASLEDAESIELHQEQIVSANFAIPLQQPIGIHGRLPAGATGAQLTLHPAIRSLVLPQGIPLCFDSYTKTFRGEGVPKGQYVLEGEWTTDELHDYGSLKLDLTWGIVGSEDIILSPTVQISGVLSNIPADANVTGLRLEGIDGALADIKTSVINGSFSIANVHSGEYTMIVDGIPNSCVARLRVGDEDQEGPRIIVKAGEDSLLLTAIIKYDTFPIQGSVRDDDIGRANVEVIAQGEDSGRLYATQSNAEGHFLFSNMCPGRYRLYSWPSNSVEYRDPPTLLNYKIDSTEVSVSSWNLVNKIELSLIKTTIH